MLGHKLKKSSELSDKELVKLIQKKLHVAVKAKDLREYPDEVRYINRDETRTLTKVRKRDDSNEEEEDNVQFIRFLRQEVLKEGKLSS